MPIRKCLPSVIAIASMVVTPAFAADQPVLAWLSPGATKAAPLPAYLRRSYGFEVTGPAYRVQQISASAYRTSARPLANRQSQPQSTNPNSETYRGYFADLSEIAERQDFALITDALRHQIDIVEGVGLSRRVLQFFHTVPILVDEFACLGTNLETTDTKSDTKMPVLEAACYGPFAPKRSQSKSHSIWNSVLDEKFQLSNFDLIDQADYTGRGVVSVRPITLDGSSKNAQRPVILHEMFHAYHANIMPQGVKNPSILFYYNEAKSKQLYPADAYVMTNEKEFFAVTASVFLSGMADGGATPSDIKQKQPDYFNYLRWLLEINPDGAPSASPAASAE